MTRPMFFRHILSGLICSILSLPASASEAIAPAVSPPLSFNTSLLHGNAQGLDLDALFRSNGVMPGRYRVDIYAGNRLVGRQDVTFANDPSTGQAGPCITTELLEQSGVDMTRLLPPPDSDRPSCQRITDFIETASTDYDPNMLALTLNIPQAAMSRKLRGYVPPAAWEAGNTLGFINYYLSSRHSRQWSRNTHSTYLGLRSGLNIAGWRLRSESNLNSSTGQSTHYSNNLIYLQHDVTPLKSQFTLGDTYSDSTLFDSVRFRGIMLKSDEDMRPDSERGYAPVIRGTAETNATIEIRQNGFLLYSTNVSPGPFVIDDLPSSGSNGDLEVTIIEADGRRRVLRQAFANPPLMLREGRLTYSLELGRFRSHDDNPDTPRMASGSVIYGLTDTLTAAGGLQATAGYRAFVIGAGWNAPIGALSLDLTRAESRIQASRDTGHRLSLRYAQYIPATDTRLSFSLQRYSSPSYRNLGTHVAARSHAFRYGGYAQPRTRFEMALSQNLGKDNRYGSLYLNGNTDRDWARQRSTSLSAGYGNAWRQVNYNIDLSYNRNIQNGSYGDMRSSDTTITLSLSLPLGSHARAPYATFNLTRNRNSGSSMQAGLNGWLPTESDISYALQTSRASDNDFSGSASLNATTSVGTLGVGHSLGSHYRSTSLNAAGSIMAHADGINLGQSLSETFALVQLSPARSGVRLRSHNGVSTGHNGYAIIPSATPYRINWIELDTNNLGSDIELDNAVRQVVPRRGAGVLARFQGIHGLRVQFELQDTDGRPLPFGTMLDTEQGEHLGIADPRGRVLALVEQPHGRLILRWNGQQCNARYTLPERQPDERFQQASLTCSDAIRPNQPAPTPPSDSHLAGAPQPSASVH